MFQRMNWLALSLTLATPFGLANNLEEELIAAATEVAAEVEAESYEELIDCLLYTSPSPRDKRQSRMPSSA